MNKLVKKLDKIIRTLENIENKSDLLERTIDDLNRDSYNLEKAFKIKGGEK